MNAQSAYSKCVRVLTADRNVYRLEVGTNVLILHGPDARSFDQFIRNSARIQDIDGIVEAFVSSSEECTAILLTVSTGSCTAVSIWRGINSDYECFFAITAAGDILISDSFRNIVSEIPVAQRTLTGEAYVNHMLFRTIPGKSTLLSNVQRVGHGEHITLRTSSGDITRRQFERLAVELEIAPNSSRTMHTNNIERVLGDVVRMLSLSGDSCGVLLSGGVDSTLIAALLGSGTRTVAAAIDSPEWALEREYSRNAARLVGSAHQIIETTEESYLERLEGLVESSCISPHHLQTVLIDDVFRNDAMTTYLCGEFADGLFGTATAITAARWLPVERLHSRLPKLVQNAISNQVIPRFAKGGSEFWRRTRYRSSDWRGIGAQAAILTDLERVTKMFGVAPVMDAIQTRWAYGASAGLQTIDSSSGVLAHLEAAQILAFLTDGTMTIWRQVAFARGKSLHSPYAARSVVNALLRIPPLARYVHAGVNKHLLKTILRRKIPAYEVNARKLSSGMPVKRFFVSGPLKNALTAYRVDDWLPKDIVAEERLSPSCISWNALTWSMLRDKVVRNSSIELISGSQELQLPI